MSIDKDTGLEELPEGYRWKLSRALLMGDGWTTVKLQQSTRFGWRTLRRDENSISSLSYRLPDLKDSWFNREEHKAAAKKRRAEANKPARRAQAKLDRVQAKARTRAIRGVYPPRKIGDVK